MGLRLAVPYKIAAACQANNGPTAPNRRSSRFLGSPATHGGAPVERLETRTPPWFFSPAIAPQGRARGALSLLDYSTLDRRKAACLAELEVNRNFAPQLYRRIVAVTRRADGALALDGPGEPVEWPWK